MLCFNQETLGFSFFFKKNSFLFFLMLLIWDILYGIFLLMLSPSANLCASISFVGVENSIKRENTDRVRKVYGILVRMYLGVRTHMDPKHPCLVGTRGEKEITQETPR